MPRSPRVPRLQSSLVLDAPRPAESGTFLRAARERVLARPDPRLSQRAVEVDPRDPAIADLARILVATMYAWPVTYGLAAPQLGETARVLCVDVSRHPRAGCSAGLVVLVNPRILRRAGNVVMQESCASVPHLTGAVARAETVTVEGTVPGTTRIVRLEADGVEARSLLHQLDHLDGYLIEDRMLETSEASGSRTWCA